MLEAESTIPFCLHYYDPDAQRWIDHPRMAARFSINNGSGGAATHSLGDDPSNISVVAGAAGAAATNTLL